MKALTICQPYAELIARGEKLVENRTWPTYYRGQLAIHAGKSRDWLSDGDEERYPGMVYGAVVAIATLSACLRAGRPWPPEWRHLEDHEHTSGPWCWVLENVQRLDAPIPSRGAQGIWEWRR